MNFFIFDFTLHQKYIESFLVSASLAHQQHKKSCDWYYWKFRDNPFGETILACAEEDGDIVGCVGYGFQDFIYNNNILKGVISFETFIHPDFQGRGLFSELIKYAESIVIKRNVDLMLNFPNSNSLRGFLKGGWKQIESPEYWIKWNGLLKIPFILKDIRQKFNPNAPNLNALKRLEDFYQSPLNQLHSVITEDYLKWRFFTYPVAEYVVIDKENYQSIIRIGNRGRIREGQVLFLNILDENKFKMKDFLWQSKRQANYDMISFSITQSNPLLKYLKQGMFIKVPNNTNICYKILNPKVINDDDVKNISLSAINYHTY